MINSRIGYNLQLYVPVVGSNNICLYKWKVYNIIVFVPYRIERAYILGVPKPSILWYNNILLLQLPAIYENTKIDYLHPLAGIIFYAEEYMAAVDQ